MKTYVISLAFIISISLFSTCILTVQSEPSDVIDISVLEAWELLSDTSNGIQIPIDVRTDSEWNDQRIDTPFPEFPRHFEKSDIVDEITYQYFVELYNGSDVVVYCKSGGRSASAANILISRGFNGTVYNVLGGITDWNGAGLPIKNGNNLPETPETPIGSVVCTLNSPYSFTSSTIDIDDDVLRLGWDWDADNSVDEWTDYQPSGASFEISHSWSIAGNTSLQVIAEDLVGEYSSFSDALSIYVNTPPTIESFEGPDKGGPGEVYAFIIQGTDADNDMVSYQIDWGDGSGLEILGPYPADEQITVTHTWDEKGSYAIDVTVIDEWGAESNVYTHAISMPKTKIVMSIFEYFIHLFHVFHSLIH